MADYSLLSVCLLRIALPIILTLCVIFRPCVLSAMYLLLFFYLPVVPVPTPRTMAGHTGCYLKIVICISFLTSISQVVFQIVLLSMPPYGHFLRDCEFLERILRHVGFIRLDKLNQIEVVQWLSPEIVMLFSSIGIYVIIRKLTDVKAKLESAPEEGNIKDEVESKRERKVYAFIVIVGKYASIASLAIAGCLRPSVPGAVYFLVFLGGATCWACCKELRKIFAYICRIVLVIVFFHISVLYAYQFQWPQEYLSPNSTYARYFGLTPLITFSCEDPRYFNYSEAEWASYLNPIWLLWLYYILAFVSKILLSPMKRKKFRKYPHWDGGSLRGQQLERFRSMRFSRDTNAQHRWHTATRKVRVKKEAPMPTETTPLMGGPSLRNMYLSSPSQGHGLRGSQDDIPMHQLGKGPIDEDAKNNLFDNIIYGLVISVQILMRSSYIGTSIIMMAWSITYHSWLTFILLLWAILLWLLPNQRRAMLRSAPFLVVYAEFLLLSAYVYSMNLTEEELPSHVKNINLAQIGFVKVSVLPFEPLIVKCLYTTVFWFTLRQFMKERKEAREASLPDMVTPSDVVMTETEDSKGKILIRKLGEVIKRFMTQFWIFFVVVNLFLVAITGERMTGFRIIYMLLFLDCIITFQLSFTIWRKVIFGFLITVIGYSMLILILIYTYQFDNFPEYWTTYIHIPPEQQLDLGLERYETKQLFVRLATPTLFLVITVIQVHYFHNEFLEITKIRCPQLSEMQRSEPRSEASSAQGGPWDPESERTDTESTHAPHISGHGFRRKNRVLNCLKYISEKVVDIMNCMWLFFEIHMFKVVMVIMLLLTVFDTCAINFVILLLTVLAVTVGRKFNVFAIHICSIIVSIMLIARMIYQIQYIHHEAWDVTCEISNSTKNESTFNNAAWLGFRKVEEGHTFISLVKWYVAFIFVETIRALVKIRQRIVRISEGQPAARPFFLFSNITRIDADKSISLCLKYLCNYGYYKFGVEISLMATVALIGIRMDFYACLYAIWLCVLCMKGRRQLSNIWKYYLAFVTIVLPIQYFMVVGLPPGICIDLPWHDIGNKHLEYMQEWLFFFNLHNPPSAKKLICDIFVLIFVARQSLVFRIERRYDGVEHEYRGGSNQSIIHKLDEPNYVNPVPDFVTYIRSWLDIFKRIIILSFIWVTLAVVFLAGTNRVDFFSLGYLIGSFIFLWQGTDLYLRSVPYILKSWNWLIGYNVFVILIKVLLQIAGCIFIDDINQCWLIRLFGIGCIQKFTPSTLPIGPETSSCSPVPREDIGLAWDGLCFGFLIMQRRIFNSYYFFHMIDEAKATAILASRGAELMEELRHRKLSRREEEEGKILQKIKHKMDRIKATQQKIQGSTFQETTNHYVESAPIARSPSLSSCTSTSATSEHTAEAGYHTPIDEEEPDEDPAPLTPRTGSLLQTQAASPCSALMTVSLDGYLEPQRMSFSSPPNSELNPRPISPDESFPVFSPPPYEAAVGDQRVSVQRQTSVGPPWMQGCFITPRQSVISYSSRSPQSHHTYHLFPGTRPLRQRKIPTSYKSAIRSGDYYMFDDIEGEELDLLSEKEESDISIDEDKSDDITVGEFFVNIMTGKSNIDAVKRRKSAPAEMINDPSRQFLRQHSMRSQLSAPQSILSKSDKGSPRRTDRGVTIKEESMHEIEKDEPKPGSSKQKEEDEMSLISQPTESVPLQKKVSYAFLTIWIFIQSLMNSITYHLNRASKDYRYVLRVLSKEKKILKEKTNYRLGSRKAYTDSWEPANSFHHLIRQASEDSADTTAAAGDLPPTDSYRRAPCSDRSHFPDDVDSVRQEFDDNVDIAQQESSLEPIIPSSSKSHSGSDSSHRRKTSVLTVPEIRILAPSLERGLDCTTPRSQSPVDVMAEYETTEMSSANQPSFIRLLHAIWFLILSYSDILCYIVIFLNQMRSASFLALPLPFMVFLWGTLTIPRPTKTFWITIIAYTQVIVLIKCIFQFNILDDDIIHSTNPFYPPKIIGIERTRYYATYDLLLLFVVFFHRLMLKTLGLWKSSSEPLETIEEGIFQINDDVDDDDDADGDKQKLSSKLKERTLSDVLDYYHTHFSHIDVPEEIPKSSNPSSSKSSSFKLYSNSKVKTNKSISNAVISRPSDLKFPNNEEPSNLDDSDEDNEERNKNSIKISTREVPTFTQLPGIVLKTAIKYFGSTTSFFKQLLDPTSRISADVYAYMFLCDFFNFLVVIFGFASFGTQQGDGGVSTYLQENKVPIPFLLMLILQFILIIVDRALYLRKFILGKIIFQFLQIIGVHIWMFIVLPAVTERSFNALLPPQMWYMVKCFYLLLSAYQIRSGYPSRILGNFLCKGYGYLNMFLFKGFMIIPFLFELRAIMDWMWTDTSMTIFDWLKMEDIFVQIFQLKCARHVETEFPQTRGEKKPVIIKYFMGGALLFIIIAVIWFPLVFFALGSTVGESSIPYDVTVNVRIGPYQPIYSMSAQTNSIYRFTEEEYNIMQNNYKKHRVAMTFLSSYKHDDITAIILNGNSTMIWAISPPDINRMLLEVLSDKDLVLRLQYTISRLSNNKQESGIVTNEIKVKIPANIGGKQNPNRINLAKMLQGEAADPLFVKHIFPKFVKVTNNAVTPVSKLLYKGESIADNSLRDLKMRLSRSQEKETSSAMWWEFQESCTDTNYQDIIIKIPRQNCAYLVMYAFNERSFPASLSFLSGGGIIGLYTTLVFVASRMIRGFFSEICFKIMFDDMPNVDRILQLCLDIYLVREARELCLEEDLFAKLVFLFRSPETLIKWTRPKEEDENEGDDPEAEPQPPAIAQ